MTDADGLRTHHKLNPGVFWPAAVVVFSTGAFMNFAPKRAESLAQAGMAWITGNFGWLFMLMGVGALALCLWLAFGRYSRVKLGAPEDGPEFSEVSWASMMFAAGIGIGLISWSFVEPIFYFTSPPLGIEARSSAAAEWGHMYAQFHWGVVPWAFYALMTIPVAYTLYVRNHNVFALSEAMEPVAGGRGDRILRRAIDITVIIGMIGGAGTSIGLGVPIVTEFASHLFGFSKGYSLEIGVLVLWTLIFASSVYLGLKRGIRFLSDFNIALALVIVALVFLMGPTRFIATLWANSFGLMMDNFFRMSFWLDPIDQGSFPQDWTLFYWAWWIAYAPLMGLFFGRISRGRTIRQTILGILIWGSLGCWSYLAICGAYALHLEINGIVAVSEILNDQGMAPAILAIVQTLPFAELMILAFFVLAVVFLATTLDSVAFVFACLSTKNISGEEEPARWLRLTWAFALAFIALGLLAADGIRMVRASTVITALPLIPVILIVTHSTLRRLFHDFSEKITPPTYALSIDEKGKRQIHEI